MRFFTSKVVEDIEARNVSGAAEGSENDSHPHRRCLPRR